MAIIHNIKNRPAGLDGEKEKSSKYQWIDLNKIIIRNAKCLTTDNLTNKINFEIGDGHYLFKIKDSVQYKSLEDSVTCPKCNGDKCEHCGDRGYHLNLDLYLDYCKHTQPEKDSEWCFNNYKTLIESFHTNGFYGRPRGERIRLHILPDKDAFFCEDGSHRLAVILRYGYHNENKLPGQVFDIFDFDPLDRNSGDVWNQYSEIKTTPRRAKPRYTQQQLINFDPLNRNMGGNL